MLNQTLLGAALALILGASAAHSQAMTLLRVGAQMAGQQAAAPLGRDAAGLANAVNEARRAQLARWITANGITPRGQWTQIQGNEARMQQDWDYDAVVLHHSGDNGQTNPEAILRLHITPAPDREVFDDIGYHFAIRPDGEVLEARSLLFKGSHCRQNTKKIGVILLGDFMPQWWDGQDDEPTAAQLNSLRRLTGALKRLFPTVAAMRGHRDFVPRSLLDAVRFQTERDCPGDSLYNRLPALRRATRLR